MGTTKSIALKKQTRSGFTLAELLVASTLISIVLGSIYTIFFSVTTSWRVIEKNHDPYKDARNFYALFKREFANIEASTPHLFQGDDDTISFFVVSDPLQLDEGEGRHLLQVEYRYSKSKDEIIREEAFVETALPKPAQGNAQLDRGRVKTKHKEEFVVATHVMDFYIRYVWYPVAPRRQESNMINTPPPQLAPIFKEEHRDSWGRFPHAVEVSMELEDPADNEVSQVFTLLIPYQGQRWFYTMDQLNGIFMGRRR